MHIKNSAKTASLICAMVLFSVLLVPAYASEKNVKSVQINLSICTVRVNQTRLLYTIVNSPDADNPYITWNSSNFGIASVDGNGIVTGIKPGTVEITAQSNNGKIGRCTVTVLENLTGISVFERENDLLTITKIRPAVEDEVYLPSTGDVATVVFEGYSSVTVSAIQTADYIGSQEDIMVILTFLTMDSGTMTEEGRLTIDAANAEDLVPGTLSTSVHTGDAIPASYIDEKIKAFGDRATDVYLSQLGEFGMMVKVQVSANDASAPTEQLHLYHYDDTAKAFVKVSTGEITCNTDGTLTFATNTGGYYVITNQ